MIPLYLGRVASFVKENHKSSAKEVEEKIESLCRVFEEMKPYLIERWGIGSKEEVNRYGRDLESCHHMILSINF